MVAWHFVWGALCSADGTEPCWELRRQWSLYSASVKAFSPHRTGDQVSRPVPHKSKGLSRATLWTFLEHQVRVCRVMVPSHVHSKHQAKGQERLRVAWCQQPCDREDTSKRGTNPFYLIDMQLQRPPTQGFLTSLQSGAVRYFFCVYATILKKLPPLNVCF